MKLMTKAIEKKLPALYSTEAVEPEDKKLIVKFFCPWNNWNWYGVEFDPEQGLFFGYVEGFENEWGMFSLEELASVTGLMGLKIERDRFWKPKTFKEYISE